MLNVIVADMAATPDFYQRLGIAAPEDAATAHLVYRAAISGGIGTRLPL